MISDRICEDDIYSRVGQVHVHDGDKGDKVSLELRGPDARDNFIHI